MSDWYDKNETKGDETKDDSTLTPGPIVEIPLKERLRTFYRTHNPDMLSQIDEVIKNIELLGEDKIHDAMMERYGKSIWTDKPQSKRTQPKPACLLDDLCVLFKVLCAILIAIFVCLYMIRNLVLVMRFLDGQMKMVRGVAQCIINPDCPFP
jgi:hypothetical protein